MAGYIVPLMNVAQRIIGKYMFQNLGVIWMDHTFVHFEIPVDDVEKMRRFYSKAFGWKIERMPGPMEYWNIETVPVDEKGVPVRRGVNGGLIKKERSEQSPLSYIGVESLDECTKKVESAGGKVLMRKEEVPGMGWWALIQDPEGNSFGLFQPK